MRKLSLGLFAILFYSLYLGTVFAQSEKVTISFVPKPNQTNRLTNTQEINLVHTWEGNVPDNSAALESQKVLVKIITEMIYQSGPIDAEGHLEVEATIEKMTADITVNGKPHPEADEAAKAAGAKVKAIFDGSGKMIEAKTSSGMGNELEQLMQTWKSSFGTFPSGQIGVGDSILISTINFLPISMISETPTKIPGISKAKLVVLDKEADSRIANFELLNEASLIKTDEIELSMGKVTYNLDIKMTGGGKLQFNLDKCMVKESESSMNISGKITFQLKNSKLVLPYLTLKGNTKTTYMGTN